MATISFSVHKDTYGDLSTGFTPEQRRTIFDSLQSAKGIWVFTHDNETGRFRFTVVEWDKVVNAGSAANYESLIDLIDMALPGDGDC